MKLKLTPKPRAYPIPCYVVPKYGRVTFHPCTAGGVIDHTLRNPALWRVFINFEWDGSRKELKGIGALWFPANVENFVKDRPDTKPSPNAAIAAFYMLKALAMYDGKDLYAYADKNEWPQP